MAKSKSKARKPKKGRCDDCPVVKGKKLPLVERTNARGTVDLKFPGFEATFPGTNRSIMIIICTGILALVIIVPVVFYQVFSADPEALERVGDFFDSDDKPREPVKVPVKTDDGIEIIEVCPPCDDWSQDECEERYGQCGVNCPQCPVCPVCQTCPPAAPPSMASPQKSDAPLL